MSIFLRYTLACIVVVALSACAVNQQYSETYFNADLLPVEALEQHGLAFLTPSTITGQEEDTQALALAFAKVISAKRPNIKLVNLSQTLSLINQHHLANEYKRMYQAYRDTGLLNEQTLSAIGKITNSRYLIQLKLANFSQGSSTRWNLLGLKITQTNKANIRLFMQIWDSHTGMISFEGSEELNKSRELVSEEQITFKQLVQEAGSNLLATLP